MSLQRQDEEYKRDPYHDRQQSLTALGFASYTSYLRSTLWRAIRQRVLDEHSTCLRCGRKATQIHHGSYDRETMDGTSTAALVSACKACHRRAERYARHLRGWERLNAVTVQLMASSVGRRPSRFRPRRQKAASIWSALRKPFNPTPRLIKRPRLAQNASLSGVFALSSEFDSRPQNPLDS